MKKSINSIVAACLVVTSIGACGGGADSASEVVASGQAFSLVNASFEDKQNSAANCVTGWGCQMHADPTSYRFTVDTQYAVDGAQSLLIERIKPEPWSLVGQQIRVSDYIGRRMTLVASIRMDGVGGNGGGLFYRIGGILNNVSDDAMAYQTKMVLSAPNWQVFRMEFTIPANARVLTVGALLEGPGKMWVDKVSLSVAP